MNRLALTRCLYGCAIAIGIILSVLHGTARLGDHILAVAVIAAIAICGHLVTYDLHRKNPVTHQFDMDLGLALVALLIAGPVAGVLVGALPEALYLVRRRRWPWHLGATANWASIVWSPLAGAAVLSVIPASGLGIDLSRFTLAGAGMLAANYTFARLILEVLIERARPLTLLRTEFLRGMPVELPAIAIGVISALLVPEVGVLALAGFAAVVYLPQYGASLLLRAPSVAGLTVGDAAAVYRAALADEMRFSGAQRRHTHVIDALVRREPLPTAPSNPFAAAKDALLVTICTERPPTQKQFSASEAAQVVLVARGWAQLTARCTPALSHREAMTELRCGSLADDAPLALAAAGRIVEREHALSTHIAAAPALHRAPLPRALRQGMLPLALTRLVS